MPRKASVILTQGTSEPSKTLAQQLKAAQKAVRDHEREAKRAAAEANKLLEAINKKRDEAAATVKQLGLQLEA
jgi:ABC-type transporter Mla subunit MlaD